MGAKDLFLLIPEGAKAPKNLSKNITPLSLPLQNTYVVSTAAMDPIRQVGGLTGVGYTGTRASGWHVKGIAKMVQSGRFNTPAGTAPRTTSFFGERAAIWPSKIP